MIFCYLNDNASIDVLPQLLTSAASYSSCAQTSALKLEVHALQDYRICGFQGASGLSVPPLPSSDGRTLLFCSGGHLLSHAVSSIVPSAVQVLTVVFGMGTGVSPARIAARSPSHLLITQQRDTFPYFFFLRKEVIQPHLPIRLPCYDFTPGIGPTLGSSLLAVGSLTSGVADSHGVTGGVYKTRERIHRSMLICDY